MFMVQLTQRPQEVQASQDERANEILETMDRLFEELWQTNVHDLPSDLQIEVIERVRAWASKRLGACYCNAPTHRGVCPAS
jgi:hypothetical protein